MEEYEVTLHLTTPIIHFYHSLGWVNEIHIYYNEALSVVVSDGVVYVTSFGDSYEEFLCPVSETLEEIRSIVKDLKVTEFNKKE